MIDVLLSNRLREVLCGNNVDPEKEYVPAYHGESAGLDLYNTLDKEITLSPSRILINEIEYKQFKILIPTGLKVSIPKGYVGLIQERGSITKTTLKVRAGVVDSGYTGEIFVNCVNIGNSSFTIQPGNKLPFQLVVVKCDNIFNVVNEEEYNNITTSSKRKEGHVGSSD